MGLISQKSLFCLFLFTSILFVLSWFFLLRSAGPFRILPHSKIFSIVTDEKKSDSRSSHGNNDISNLQSSSSVVHQKDEASYSNSIESRCKKDVLKVFMYDLPSEFHFGLLGGKAKLNDVWPDIQNNVPEYPGGLNLQHSIEYWLTLDLLYSEFAVDSRGRTAVRVTNSSEADVVFVPFFSSVSYNRFSKTVQNENKSVNTLLQEKLVTFLTSQEEWKRSGGMDHIIVAHHPNSLLEARAKLWPAMFVLADFGRYPPTIANVEKDIIAPYKHVIGNYVNDSSDFDSRPNLLYFQGAIYRKDGGIIRQELFYILKDEKDVHFSFGSVQNDGIHRATEGMHSSKFCLNIAGDTPSSNRLFDAIASHCVPVIISDEIELPYEDVLDYSEFSIFVRTIDALKEKFLTNLTRNIGKDEWTRMWNRLKEVENFFEFRFPSRNNDAVQMIWQAIARKVPNVRMKLHKSRRFSRTLVPRERERERSLISLPVPRNFW